MVVMEQEDKEIWVDFKANVTNRLTPEYRKVLCTLHAKYYNHKYSEPCTCNGRLYKTWIADIDKIYVNK